MVNSSRTAGNNTNGEGASQVDIPLVYRGCVGGGGLLLDWPI